MRFEPNQISMGFGLLLLVLCGAWVARPRPLAGVRSTAICALIAAIIYPLVVCLVMGIGGSRALPEGYRWIGFRVAISTYAQTSLVELVPRGAVMGAFLAVSCGFWRRTMRRQGVASAVLTDP